ncbi:bifunctional riboflavin kinase/FAD synthetase, partial [Escherichia coli]|nr:bifunctional riboflavin kinase/FAD synthetase [Escherichia coli]
GHHKVFEALDERAAAQNLKKAVTTFDPHPSVVLNPERKRTDYLTPLSDKLEMIEQHDVDYCIVINFSSRFASVTAEEFV